MNTVVNKELSSSNFNTTIFPTWCPGCGDFGIWGSLKQALVTLKLRPHEFLTVFGIGCSGNMAGFLHCYGFHGLHGRAIPIAIGAKLAQHKLPILVVGGDGDLLGEGLSHFVHAARSNHDITVILHNNQVYGLTTGQAAPTALMGFKAKATSNSGSIDEPINPCLLAIAQKAGFVARGFAGDMPYLSELIVKAVQHSGFSLVEVLQPCVTFDKEHTYEWFRSRIKKVPNPTDDMTQAIQTSLWGQQISVGVLYQNPRPAFHTQLKQLQKAQLVETTGIKRDITTLLQLFK